MNQVIEAADVSHVERDDLPAVRPEPAMNPLMLLQQAVERGMDPGQLKALVDLQEQWRAARAKEAFAAAMNAVQIEMPCIVKDALNTQTSSRYVRLETVMHAAKPIVLRHGFSISFSEAECTKPEWKRIVCVVRHCEGHEEQHFTDLPIDGVGPKGNAIGGMNRVQGAVSTGSYGQRVLFCRVFDITIADTDLDGQSPNPAADPAAPKAAPRAQRQKPQETFAVSRDQMAHVAAHWKSKNPDPDGNTERQRQALSKFVIDVSGRGDWKPNVQAEWTRQDYEKCCYALNIDPEDAQ